MLNELGLVVLTALLSSLFTLGLARLALDHWKRRNLQRMLTEVGDVVERRVRAGAIQAGEDLLPEVKKRIQESFEHAILGLASGGTVERSLEEAAKSGARKLGERLDSILGGRK